MSTSATPLYRLDQFTVPLAARDEFLNRVTPTHELLRTQPGFVRDVLLEQRLDDHTLRLVTLVQWQDDSAVAGARAAVAALHARLGFEPRALMARLGIVAEMGEYRDAAR